MTMMFLSGEEAAKRDRDRIFCRLLRHQARSYCGPEWSPGCYLLMKLSEIVVSFWYLVSWKIFILLITHMPPRP